MEKEKINENYDLMDENEKFAMRYGAKGRDLGDVIRDNPGKITNPEKILYAWDKGMNLRKDGSSKYFLDRIEKAEMDNLKSTLSQGGSTPLGLSGKTDGNGISSEPERDIWGNDLFKDASFGNREEFTFDLREEKNPKSKEDNYLLKKDENYGRMYVTKYSNEDTSEKNKDGKFKFSIKPEDIYKAIGWICTFGGLFKGGIPSAIDLAEQNLLSQEEEDDLPEHFNSMGLDEGSRALEDWNREQLYGK